MGQFPSLFPLIFGQIDPVRSLCALILRKCASADKPIRQANLQEGYILQPTLKRRKIAFTTP